MSNDAPNTATEPMVKVELKRNYAPLTMGKIIGHQREERKAKDAAGREHVVQEEAFIEGEMYPPIFPGVGYPGKIWAGTVIEVSEAEARDMRRKGIAEVYL